jgi:hypothetical protein
MVREWRKARMRELACYFLAQKKNEGEDDGSKEVCSFSYRAGHIGAITKAS